MPKLDVINAKGEKVETVEAPEFMFTLAGSESMIHDAVRQHWAATRRGTVSTLTKSETAYSGRKPWRQKGTGRARAGATRSPLWRKGGTTFGPQPRDYSYDLPKASKKNALRSALALKFSDKQLLILDDLKLKEAKTKAAAELLKGLHVDSALIVDSRDNANLFRSLKNLRRVKAVDWSLVNTHDVLKYKWLVLSQQAFESLMEKLK